MGLYNLITAFQAIGLTPPPPGATDVSYEAIDGKITNEAIHQALGGTASVPIIRQAEYCANLLDSFSESGDWQYAYAAQVIYEHTLSRLSPASRERCSTIVAAIFNYFSFEHMLASRIERGGTFSSDEQIEYLLRRGSDAILYAALLEEIDGISAPGLTTALRYRQALWDFNDDLRDLAQDRLVSQVNIVLLTGEKRTALRRLAHRLWQASQTHCRPFRPVYEAAETEFGRICASLN